MQVRYFLPTVIPAIDDQAIAAVESFLGRHFRDHHQAAADDGFVLG